MLANLRKRFLRLKRAEVALPQADSDAEYLIMHLAGAISEPSRAVSVMEKVRSYQRLSREQQQKQLSAHYLMLEQYLTEVDATKPYTRMRLRVMVRSDHRTLLNNEEFGLIFEPEHRQELLLARSLLLNVAQRAKALMGATYGIVYDWLQEVPYTERVPTLLEPFEVPLPSDNRSWVSALRELSAWMQQRLELALGPQIVLRMYERAYNELAEQYMGLETFPVIISLLPEPILDDQKLGLLSQRQIRRALLRSSDELRLTNAALISKNRILEKTRDDLLVLKESNEATSLQFRAVLDAVGEGIFTCDATGIIKLVNQSMTVIWHLAPEQFVGAHLSILLPSESVAEDATLHEMVPHLGSWYEMIGQRPAGSTFPFEILLTETRVGRRLWYTAAVRDITDRKRGEESLKMAHDYAVQANDLKTSLLLSVSHDLRTPLNAIVGYTEMMQEHLYGSMSKEQQDILERVLLSSGQLTQLVNELLELARSDKGKLEIRQEPYALATILTNVQTVVFLEVRDKGLRLVTHLDERLPAKLIGDRQRIQQVVVNLVQNGIKFTTEGTIRVAFLRSDAHSWQIKVSDTGKGIPAEQQQHIFEPFQRGEMNSAAAEDGFGLGLAIVAKLISLMRGEIQLSSIEGQGSEFTVTLPLESVEEGNP